MAEIPSEFEDILPPAPDSVNEDAIPPDAEPEKPEGDVAPETEGEPEKPEAPDTVEALLAKLEEEDPDAAAALIEKLEKEDAPPPEPAAPSAIPDADRVMMEKAEINDIVANLDNTVNVYQANWNHAWNEYKQAESALGQYAAKCQEKGEECDPQVIAMFQQNINVKLTENNRIAQESQQAHQQNLFIKTVKREMDDYPAFGKYPKLYAAMRGHGHILNTMPIQQRMTLLMEEAKRQGIVAGEPKDPKKIDRLRKAVARLKGGKSAGATTATRRAAANEDKDMKDVPANLRAKFDYALSRL